jgi:hypothetical protein
MYLQQTLNNNKVLVSRFHDYITSGAGSDYPSRASIDLFLKLLMKRYLAMNRYIGGKIVQPTVKRTSCFNITPEVVTRLSTFVF